MVPFSFVSLFILIYILLSFLPVVEKKSTFYFSSLFYFLFYFSICIVEKGANDVEEGIDDGPNDN